jgi:NADH:ubiquinone oxidoreductase subunit 6 (subunit J)
MGLLIFVFHDTSWSTGINATQAGPVVTEGDPTTSAIAEAIFDKESGFLLPLEISAMMILAAVVGAIALVKDD